MIIMPFALLLIFLIGPAAADPGSDPRSAFYGTWGSAEQCARAPIKRGGTVLSQPFEISQGWLKQGQFWCGLNWGPVASRGNGLFAGAHAQCGEDAQRSYFLGMILNEGQLQLRWDFPLSNGPLKRCKQP